MRRTIIGITRFALIGDMGEGAAHFPHRKKPKTHTRAQWVHAPGYIAHRLQLFETFALPSILQMQHECPKGYQYIHLVATNAELPNYRELRAVLPDRVEIVDIPMDAPLHLGLQSTIESYGLPGEYFTFRLDDDDALAGTYPQLVARLWDDDRHKGVITPAYGFYIGLNRHKPGLLPLRMVRALNLGSPHGTGAYNQNIHALGKHNAIPHMVPVEQDVIYWLRTVHRSNVTLAGHAGTPWGSHASDEAEPMAALAHYFPALDPAKVRAAFLASPHED